MNNSLFDLLMPPPERTNRYYGVVTARVTNTDDPEELGRVKLTYPWLADNLESSWARLAMPMAGAERGLYRLPEIDDEVLVVFEHGDLRFPYVIGALWNSRAKPPQPQSDAKDTLALVSRSGSRVTISDADGKEKIEISDKDAKNSITIDIAAGKLIILANNDIEITATNGKLKLSGQGVEITSKADVKIEAQASGELKASGQLTIKGATVNIN